MNAELEAIYARFEETGPQGVRKKLASHEYQDGMLLHAERWLGLKDEEARSERDIAAMALAVEANELTRTANAAAEDAAASARATAAAALEANRLASNANLIATIAIIIALIAIAISVIVAFVK